MDPRPTCGQGLAENAALLAKLSELTSAVGDILEAHLPSLDLTDEHSRKEHEVYRHLVEDHQRVSLQLEAIARLMAGSRDLPMGRHHEAGMASPAVSRSFQRFVRLEEELASALQRRLVQDRQILAAMGGEG
jgi:hypothetical protein